MNEGKARGTAIILVIICALIIVFILADKLFKGLGGALEFLNLRDTKEERQVKDGIKEKTEAAADPKSAWSPAFYKTAPGGAKLITVKTATTLTKQILKSGDLVVDKEGISWRDPKFAVGAIKTLYTKSQVSFLADQFRKQTGKDLLAFLTSSLSTLTDQRKQFNDLLTYVEKLPPYNV